MTELDPVTRDRIAGYLGIAQKAGKIAAGDNMALEALKKGRAVMLVLAEDAADTVKQELSDMAAAMQVPVLIWANKTDLGLIVGKSRRGALALLDQGFADAINKVLKF